MNLPASPFLPGPAFNSCSPADLTPNAPAGKPSCERWLKKTAQGFLALAGLALASCAHCPMCKHGEPQGGTRYENRCGDQACPVCSSGKKAKEKNPKAGSGPAPEKRKAKAEPPGQQTPLHNPLWFRWR